MVYFFGPEKHISEALATAVGKKNVAAFVERPENPAYGDYATNIALKLVPALRQPPMKIAEDIAAKLRNSESKKFIDRIEVAPPGFINFFLSTAWLYKQVPKIIVADRSYGHTSYTIRHKPKIQVEFISANPTGPLTLANGRGGFLGDCLANVLEASGSRVVREYYVNDAGEQVRKLGASVLAAAGYQTSYPTEGLYQGTYIQELAIQLKIPKYKIPAAADALAGKQDTSKDQIPNSKLIENVAREASKLMLKDIKRVVRKAGIRFDVWFSEKSLYRSGFVDEAFAMLKRKRLVEERDGAVWLKLRELEPGQQDRVVKKSTGEATYVLPDIAYHYEKFRRRRFVKVIDILGADHHGHARVLGTALKALGIPEPEVILLQLVRLVENGKETKMSKRSGTFVTLEELLDEVGVDVARWFFLERAPQTHMDFDLTLAKERSEKNPVFYVQYAHARCSSILRKSNADQRGFKRESTKKRKAYSLQPTAYSPHESELALMKRLVQLPDFVARIIQSHEVHHLTTYATAVATAFSAFYRDCPVLAADPEVMEARLQLVRATQIVLANTLGLMGIRALEKM